MNLFSKASLFLVSILFSCAMYGQQRLYTIPPSVTDTSIDTYNKPGDEHYVYLNDSVKPLNKLFVFLPGTLGRGKNPRHIVPFAASMGYHSISLTYSSDIALAQICKNSTDIACFEKGREEIIYGKDLLSDLLVTQPNGIENRLQKLLIYLAKNYPKDNWVQFIDKYGEIDWSKICIAGQSQGGGHAAYIAQKVRVDRVIMFAATKDYSAHFKAPAQWVKNKFATPINRQFGFVHTLDETNGCTWLEQKEIYSLTGFDKLGKWVDVDATDSPYEHTRTLTSLKPQPFPHGSPINDTAYKPVWRYLLMEKLD